jgi:hypothetical protein
MRYMAIKDKTSRLMISIMVALSILTFFAENVK